MRVLILALVFSFIPLFSYAEEVNVGFVQGLWYSSEPVFANVPTRIYVAFRNNTPHDLTGTIRFSDNTKRIGSFNVSVLSGRIAEAWVDWTPTLGEHTISVSVSDATLHVIGGASEPIDIAGLVAEDTLRVDTDTDGDKIGNTEDTDDDNDGVSDDDEKSRGTNPLVPNPKAEEKEKEQVAEKVAETEVRALRSDTSTTERGLEQYLPVGIADDLVSGVTEKIETTKVSLDEYRDERNASLYTKSSSTRESTEGGSTATITRSKIENNTSFIETVLGGLKAVFQNIWTFILFLLSGALARPAFVELLLLLFILYFIYRTARRFGRRPTYY